MFAVTSNAHSLTGEPVAAVYRRGLPLEDMEFFQFHPTGIYKMGILLSEAPRGEGGVLLNGKGERFMERYAPTLKDLAPRDMLSRFIYQEVRGRARHRRQGLCSPRHPAGDDQPLPQRARRADGDGRRTRGEAARHHRDDARLHGRGADDAKPVPIQPTAHYAMGGIPTDNDGRASSPAPANTVSGLYAAGECACVSVHGANRLGTNSLVDLMVFGRRGGKAMARILPARRLRPAAAAAGGGGSQRDLTALRTSRGPERAGALRSEIAARDDG